MKLEELFGSRGRIKILKLILEEGEINITRLVKLSGLHYNLVMKHVEHLLSLNIVRVKNLGRIRIVEANFDDPKVVALRDLIRTIESL
ncbi:ArsR family transcriptional regulator [Stetteria hydrogenophila]